MDDYFICPWVFNVDLNSVFHESNRDDLLQS